MKMNNSFIRKLVALIPFMSPVGYNWSWRQAVVHNQREHEKFMKGLQTYDQYVQRTERG